MSKSQLETLLHFHTENSRYDSVAKIKSMCLRAKELGCSAMGITEHGVLTSTYDFMDICKELDIKPIPGVEIYVGDRASHMCLYPKSQKGYIVISKLVSESFQSMTIDKTTKKKKNTKPIVSEDMLVYFLGENGEGHNEVIATSGCIGGVLCNELNYNAPFLKEVSSKKADFEKFMNKNAKNIPENYEEIYKKVQNQKEQLKKINKQLTQTKKDAKLKTTREEKTLRAFSETDDGYQNALLKLKEKQDKIDAAKKAIEELTHQKNEMTQYNKKHENIYKNIEKFIDKQNTLNETIDKITRNLLSLNDCYDRALKKAQWLLNILGEGNFYIELQYHGIPLEAQLMPQILQIAQELHIPYIVTNDAHMVSNSEKEIEAREYIRSMRYPDTFYPIDEYDKELYIKTDEELSSMLLEIFDEKVIQNGFAGCKELVDKCNVTLSKENHYPVYISEKKEENSADCLRRMCQEGIKERFTIDEWTEEYQTRLEYELDVIIRMGYADYHCIVADYLQYGKLIGQIDFNKYEEEYNKNPYDFNYLKELVEKTSGVGEGIGPGRGSAAGSLVCYLIGITDINPIKYNLLFERFLNVERVSMPDIDSDFSPEIREKVINYVRYKYGEDAVCMILTTGRLWARKAIRNVARVYGLKQRGNKLAFSSLADELCSHVPDTIGVRFKDFLYDSSVTDENGDTSLQIGLRTKYQQNPDALKILDIAECLEGVFIDYGMHAAGVIIADNHPVKNYIPLMCNDGVNWVCQCDMIRAEESGMLKMDVRIVR